jgi:hypothetical protein
MTATTKMPAAIASTDTTSRIGVRPTPSSPKMIRNDPSTARTSELALQTSRASPTIPDVGARPEKAASASSRTGARDGTWDVRISTICARTAGSETKRPTIDRMTMTAGTTAKSAANARPRARIGLLEDAKRL